MPRRPTLVPHSHALPHRSAAPVGGGQRPAPAATQGLSPPLPRTLVLVGLMGAGKTSIGKRVAARLGLDFVDADHEIEAAAGCTVAEIFERFGEAEFRNGERRVIARLLERPVHVLSTGGGAFMDPDTRALIRGRGLSLWLRADLDVLVARTARRDNRPLLRTGDPREILQRLMTLRYPIYAEADLVVDSDNRPPDETADRVVRVLRRHLSEACAEHGLDGEAEGSEPSAHPDADTDSVETPT